MSHVCRSMWWCAFSGVSLFALAGCSKNSAPPADASNATTTATAEATEEASPSDVPAAFAELTADERAAVSAQATCPVSDGALGGMGTPILVTVEGRDVWLCCAGCKSKLLADPSTYLAKLDAK